MLNDPLGILALICSVVYWWFALYAPSKPSSVEAGTEPDTKAPAGKTVANAVFLFVSSLTTSAGVYELLSRFEAAPVSSRLLLARVAALGWLLLARPERFVQLLLAVVFLFGGAGLLTKCSLEEGSALEAHPPRSL